MSGPPLFHPAKQGDRVSHDAMMTSHPQMALLSTFFGQALAKVGEAGAFAAQLGASAACAVQGVLSIAEVLPRTTTGIVAAVSPTVTVAPGLGAAVALSVPVECKAHFAVPIVPGTQGVQVQGLPLALTGGQTACGALICDGAPTIFVGGPPAGGFGSGTLGGTPIADAIEYAESIAARVQATVAAVTRGAELVEQTITETVEKVEGVVAGVSGAVSAVTGALAGMTAGGVLGAVFGRVLGDEPAP